MSSLISSNICLLCNKSNEFGGTITDKSSNIKQFIELLQRFTENKVNLKAFMTKELLENGFSTLLNICDECSSVVDHFCKLYYKLKRLEMHLEGKLDIIVDVINLGSKVPSRKKYLVEILNDKFYNERSKVSESYNLIETFRESIVHTAQQKLKLSTPRVVLKRISVNNNGPQYIRVNLTENYQILNCNSNTNCPGSFNNNVIDISTHDMDTNVSLENTEQEKFDLINDAIDEMRDIQVATSPNDIFVSDDLLPQLNDDDPSSSEEFDTVKDDQERFLSNNNDTHGDSVVLIAQKSDLVTDTSGTSQIQDVSPQISSLIVDIKVVNNIDKKDGPDVYSVSTTNNEEEFAEILPPILKTEACAENQVFNEVLSSNNAQSIHNKNDFNATSAQSNKRYNLRRKCKSKLPKEKSTEEKFTSQNSTSSESSGESEHYCSSETTTDSEDIDNDVKPLNLNDGISLPTVKVIKVKRKFKKPIKSEQHGNISKVIKSKRVPRKKKTFKCYSDRCSRIFHNEQVYQDHMKLHENGEYQCSFCEIKETNLVRLSSHEYETHSPDEKPKGNSEEQKIEASDWMCPRCLQKCFSSTAYQTHFSYTHFGIGNDPKNSKMKKVYKKRQFTKLNQRKIFFEEIKGLKGFRCPVCEILLPDKNKLKKHFYANHKQNSKNQAIASNDDNSISKRECPKSDEIFKCHFCQLSFKHAPDLAVHEIQHATQMFTQVKGQVQQNANQKKFQCPRCPYKYTNQASYIRHHLTNHLNLLANALPGACTMCSGGKIFVFNSEAHYNKIHNKSRLDDPSNISECDLCSAYFLQPFQLFLHKRKIHQQNINKCQICDKIFSGKYGLKYHLYHVHKYSDEDPKLQFGCDIKDCNKRFSSLGELDIHKRFHRNITVCKERSKGESTTCEVCGKVCKSKIRLTVHKQRVHSTKPVVCQDCGKVCKTKGILDEHMLYHQNPDEWKFECAECGKKCATKQKLEQHVRTHTKEKPFICQFCGETYAHRHNWRNHLKTKHGDEEGAQEDINGRLAKAQGASFMSRKGTKKGDCIINGKSVKV